MTDLTDKIGVTRQHRWMSADKQAEVLAPRCRRVVSLGGGSVTRVDLEDVEKLARPGTVIELVHAFLLADPRRKHARGGMKADFRAALARLEKRGAVVVDVDGQICSRKHRKAMLALVDSDIARSGRGAKSATNGTQSKGRQAADFTAAQYDAAEAIWGNTKKYREWDDTRAPLAKIVSPNGQKFTPARAHAKWGGREA